MAPRLFFSVGEPSGDLHAANLIREIQSLCPPTQCRGFGGSKMVEVGFDNDFDLTTMAVVGFSEVLPKIREFYRIADRASDIFRSRLVDAVVLVDFPGFNWHIAKRAKRFDIPVIYYCPPQLWAWGGWRVRKVKKYVDQVFSILPFERDWYQQHGVSVEYVGHPFFDEIASRKLDERFIERTRKDETVQVVVLPGSRDREIETVWPMQLEVIRRIHRQHPKVEFLIANYKGSHAIRCREALGHQDRKIPIDFFVGKTSELIEAADCAMMKSGSVSLEMMARGTPAVVLYRISPISYAIVRTLATCSSMTLPNMLAGRTIMPEYLSVGNPEVTIQKVTESMQQLITSKTHRAYYREQLLELAGQYAQPGASRRVAESILRCFPNAMTQSLTAPTAGSTMAA